jgi:plasmid stability protein
VVNILIRDVPEEVAHALDVHARSEHMSREEWLRERLTMLSREAEVRDVYTLVFSTEDPERGVVSGYVGRRGGVSTIFSRMSTSELSDAQDKAFRHAVELVSRNRTLDRERAISALYQAFDQVFEIPTAVPLGGNLPGEGHNP